MTESAPEDPPTSETAVPHATDLEVTTKDVLDLATPDAVAAFLARLGYDAGTRATWTPESLGLAAESAAAVRRVELLSQDSEGFLSVVLAQTRSLTAKVRNDLVRALGRTSGDYLLILTADFDALEFVLLDSEKSQRRGPARLPRVRVVPRIISVNRRAPSRLDLRNLRRLTWTCVDVFDQFDKLRDVFNAAAYTGEHFQNRGLFSDHYLHHRLVDDPAWRDNPTAVFAFVRDLAADPRRQRAGQGGEALRQRLFEPLVQRLGHAAKLNRRGGSDPTAPNYLLNDAAGRPVTAAFVYPWDRGLDGPDSNDDEAPDENPGGRVVSALDDGVADWIIVTNGRLWRLYSKQAHARATNFYEVDLVEALADARDTDPNEAFRYWWLFFRAEAFAPRSDGRGCWLDGVLRGSRDYAKRLGDRLKDRVFLTIFPHLAQGFLDDRRDRANTAAAATDAELADVFEATLTLLYRLLFLLYAESRDLLPIRETPYLAASLKTLKEEIAGRAGPAESDVEDHLNQAYSNIKTTIYDRLGALFKAMDQGDPGLNVPTYNGGLFNTAPDDSDRRDQRVARFLSDHKIPDRALALAVDRLARDQDEKSKGLVFIDYKSLEVRHLGSIYEGLLEFKLKVAAEDLTTQADKKGETYVPIAKTRAKASGRRQGPGVVVYGGRAYLSNDKSERRASGSYYTPDPIVEYIVAQTVGPALDAKLEALRPEFRKVRKTFDRELAMSKSYPSSEVREGGMDHRGWAGRQTYNHHAGLVERVFDLKVLDPAMGSGHFLVEVVDFVTDRLLKFLNQFPVNPVTFALDLTRRSILQSLGEQGVSVDPAKLTDVNLLKRHVLKRCVHGVDLNPMAVELAKVGLWLDAFTLGAPLSFLDHHLRVGNSLVGATFADLERATSDRLFRLDYEPLLRAINHVLLVSKDPDATAAEVAQSAARYNQARRDLSGYQLVLDLLVASHFGLPQARGLVEHGHGQAMADRDQYLNSLEGDDERRLVARVETLANRPDLRFFHWEIEFPEVFFGLLEGTTQQIRHKDRITPGSAGFDCVVGNPPYDVLAEKELETSLEELLGYLKGAKHLAAALGGKQNLYKLFICRGIDLVRQAGRLGHIVPMPLLGDEQAAGVRKMLLESHSLAAVEAFPQKDDPKNRVFEDAKLSTCVFIAAKKDEDAPFRSRVHPGKTIEPNSPSLIVTRGQVGLYDPENKPILACGQEDWDLAVKIMSGGRMRRLGELCKAYQGEVNETTDGKRGSVSYDPKDGREIIRGAGVCLYVLRPASQGEPIYLRVNEYLADKKPGAKAWHHRNRRVGVQESCPQNNFRRIIASLIPKGEFCNHVINYFPEPECEIPHQMLLALLNSGLSDWYFRLGSTNAHVSHYQLYNLPSPAFSSAGPADLETEVFKDALDRGEWAQAFGAIEPLLVEAPFPPGAMECVIQLVDKIVQIESARGVIARTERSALAPEAQPYQDLVDRILYRMAGLTAEESAGLERRLATML